MEVWTGIKNCGGRRWVIPVQICHAKPAAVGVNNGLWSFNYHLLLLRRWERGMTASSVTFMHLPIWVQVWGLPFDLFSEEVGNDIGKGLGRVVEVDSKAIASD